MNSLPTPCRTKTQLAIHRVFLQNVMQQLLMTLWLSFGWLGFWGVIPSAQATDVQSHYFYTSDGARLHYLEAGQGSMTLIFIPGWLMPASIFNQQITALSKNYRVAVLDPRSQGQSDVWHGSHSAERRARDIAEWLQKIKPERFVLIGWSLGVMEGLDYVSRFRPPGLNGLVLIDNSIGEGQPPPTPSHVIKPTAPVDRTVYLHQFVRSMFKSHPSEDLLKEIDDSTLKVSAKVAAQLLAKPYSREYYRQAILDSNVPVLYAITPHLEYQGVALQNDYPKAQIRVYANAGHALFFDESDRFNEDVQHFVAQLN
jgi:microsomal epoxide hydrolase